MNGVNVQNSNGEIMNINVVRYFQLNNFDYLVFSLNEIDDGGYVKLYISKIVNSIGTTINDDVEWNLVKDTIKDIIKRNKEGLPITIKDLNEISISQLKINDQKVFKLNDSLLSLLNANKNVVEETIVNNTIIEEPINSNAFDNNINNNVEINNFNSEENLSSDIPEPPSITNLNSADEQIVPNISEPTDLNKSNDININITDSLNISDPISNQNLYYGGENTESINNQLQQEVPNDYKLMYEEAIRKNEELTNELKKYKTLIDSLKEVLK